MQRSEAVEAAIERFCERFSTADVEGFAAAVADDPDAFVIGTQRATSGRAEWMGNFALLVEKGLVRPDGSGVRVEPSGIRGFAEGGFGWAAGWITFVFGPERRLPSRFTAVLRDDGGRWRIVHAHFSVAVPDEVALEHVDAWLEDLDQVSG